MPTEKQLAANRRNSLKSTGPRTVRGKRVSSMNALRHGCASKRYIIPGENVEDYEQLHEALRRAYSPRDGIEDVLVHQLVNLSWRIRRLEHGEAMLEWYKYNCAEVDFQRRDKNHPAPPQNEDEWDRYRLGRSLQSLTDSEKNCHTALSRYVATLYRSHEQAVRLLETRRRMEVVQPDEAEDARGLPRPSTPAQKPRIHKTNPIRTQLPWIEPVSGPLPGSPEPGGRI